jgi:hypothetical protein
MPSDSETLDATDAVYPLTAQLLAACGLPKLDTASRQHLEESFGRAMQTVVGRLSARELSDREIDELIRTIGVDDSAALSMLESTIPNYREVVAGAAGLLLGAVRLAVETMKTAGLEVGR